MGVPLVHYSTNYVFDGVQGEYTEADPPAPLSVYGRSKLRGEQLAAASGAWCYVVRTAVIFGPKGASDLSKKSFVDIMLDLSAKRDTLQVVSDEINSLTYAPDLAAGTHGLLGALPPPASITSPTAAAQAGSTSRGDLPHRGKKRDRASRPLVPFPAQSGAPAQGDSPQYETAAPAPLEGRARRVPWRYVPTRASGTNGMRASICSNSSSGRIGFAT